MLPTCFSSALDTLPSAIQLSHVHQLDSQSTRQTTEQPTNANPSKPHYAAVALVTLRGGIPPIPAKLVKRIQEGSFVEMAELLPEQLRNASLRDNLSKTTQVKFLFSGRYPRMGTVLQLLYCSHIPLPTTEGG